jgi:hypothetical protein
VKKVGLKKGATEFQKDIKNMYMFGDRLYHISGGTLK